MRNVIGITGGIGSGKSTVARAFEALGYAVYIADQRAKILYDFDTELKTSVKQLVGTEIYDAEDKLIRAKLAARIFADSKLLAQINALVHPAVKRDFEAWLSEIPQNYPHAFVLKEAAILFEVGTNNGLAAVIMIYAPMQVRISRVQARDGVTVKQVRERMANQWADNKKVLLSDFVIYNDGTHPIPPQIEAAIVKFSPK